LEDPAPLLRRPPGLFLPSFLMPTLIPTQTIQGGTRLTYLLFGDSKNGSFRAFLDVAALGESDDSKLLMSRGKRFESARRLSR